MQAMVLRRVGGPLVAETRPDPDPGPGEVRIRVEACAVCRTDLHLIDSELPQAVYPVVPGHEVVGTVEALDFFALASKAGIEPRTRSVRLAWANEATAAHRADALNGAAVPVP